MKFDCFNHLASAGHPRDIITYTNTRACMTTRTEMDKSLFNCQLVFGFNPVATSRPWRWRDSPCLGEGTTICLALFEVLIIQVPLHMSSL